MTTLLARAVAVLGSAVQATEEYATVTVEVPPAAWVQTVTLARDELGMSFFDLLTAVDQHPGGFDILVRVWHPKAREGLLLRTRCPRDRARVDSLSPVFAGASWHERAVWELFGIDFVGHPGLTPLLLPDGFEGHPMRKEFVLASRVAKPWPGAPEPGESASEVAGRAPRRRTLPPGVPAPGAWP